MLFRGPVANCHTTPSLNPLKWQLAQLCHPSLESRFLSGVVAPAMASKFPREEKNTSAPTRLVSPWDRGAGKSTLRTTAMTASLTRSTTDTLRDTKLATYALVPFEVMAIPCGFLPALAAEVAALLGSFRSI